MLCMPVYLRRNKSGTLGSHFWLDTEKLPSSFPSLHKPQISTLPYVVGQRFHLLLCSQGTRTTPPVTFTKGIPQQTGSWMAVYPQKSAMVWEILGASYRTIQTGHQENTRKSLYHPDWTPDPSSRSRSHPERPPHYLCIRRCSWWRAIDTFTSSIWAKNHPTTISWNWRWSNRSNLWWWFWPETELTSKHWFHNGFGIDGNTSTSHPNVNSIGILDPVSNLLSYKHGMYKPTLAITKLYPLEIRAQEQIPQTDDETDETVPATIRNRPRRAKAMEAVQKIADWARKLRAAPEDVE